MGARIRFHELSESRYDAHAFILDEDGTRYHETATVSVSVVSAADFNEHVDKEIEQARVDQRFPLDLSLLQWAELLQLNSNTTVIRNSTMNAASGSEEDGPLLVIGIKTAVLKNFARRQAIRETWANKAVLPPHVKVFFIGCIPNKENLRDVQRHETAIALERAAYGDLLTEELVQCEDSHFLLAEKVSSFLEWVHADLPQTKYVMIADDDIYTKVNGVVNDLQSVVQREKLYLGELPNPVHHRPLEPIRDPSSLYYTSKHSYPMEQFIPYAAGPHFILSMDCVRFIARNRRRLRSLSGQDDTSVALWLLIIQVHVQQTPALVSLRFFPCKNDVLSLADLSPLGIRSIHANVLHNRPFCFGFDRTTWEWRPIE
ncbi:unnamed protein product [Phytophthora lilii]|uniref:Hexosyltransferase n=1 Tax=Phytophthora lilii TaxID=2077276 RepID=A0A9W6U8C1_9STRA|nr:unnamed protein product [Phytophthora lilii]